MYCVDFMGEMGKKRRKKIKFGVKNIWWNEK